MVSISAIYSRALGVLKRKPFTLWCISLLNILLIALGTVLFGVIPGVALGIAVLLQTAMTMIYLHGYRGQEVHSLQLFDCFRDGRTVKRVLCGMLWAGLWVLLWSLIPVVGPIFGLIRLYEYRRPMRGKSPGSAPRASRARCSARISLRCWRLWASISCWRCCA